MSAKQPVSLLGRLAIQCKLITMEQLQVATREQGRDPERRLGDIFVELGFIDEEQVRKLQKLQRDLVIKHRAKQASSGRTVSQPPLPDARQSKQPQASPAQEQTVGVLASSGIIAIGFVIFAYSGFPPTARFGVAIVIGAVFAGCATITFFPLLGQLLMRAGWNK